MNELQVFNYQSKEVSTIVKGGEIWWVAKDVCDVLEIANHRDATSRLDEDEKDAVGLTDAIGREQNTTIISEPGLYKLIARSDKPEAKIFDRWVRHEVLPSIRKTGSYSISNTIDKKMLDLQIKKDREARLMAKEKRLSAQFFEEVLDKYGSKLSPASIQQAIYEISSMLFGKGIIEKPVVSTKHYQATDIANELGISANMVGRTANKHNLKTDEYGEHIMDKSPYSDKQVTNFLYNERGKSKLMEILSPINGE